MLKRMQDRRRAILLALVCFLAGVAFKPTFLFFWHIGLSTEMHDAIQVGDTARVKSLLRWGANPNQHGMGGLQGGTPLLFAIEKSDLKMMRLLIDAGARVNEKDGGSTPLMVAWTPAMTKLLLDRGANPRLHNDKGLTAWQTAKYGGLTKLLKLLWSMQIDQKTLSLPSDPKDACA